MDDREKKEIKQRRKTATLFILTATVFIVGIAMLFVLGETPLFEFPYIAVYAIVFSLSVGLMFFLAFLSLAKVSSVYEYKCELNYDLKDKIRDLYGEITPSMYKSTDYFATCNDFESGLLGRYETAVAHVEINEEFQSKYFNDFINQIENSPTARNLFIIFTGKQTELVKTALENPVAHFMAFDVKVPPFTAFVYYDVKSQVVRLGMRIAEKNGRIKRKIRQELIKIFNVNLKEGKRIFPRKKLRNRP